ncbi:actin nucleation-promoting factor WASL-like [Macrobrachium nipponense]|uniref:actin nucleation-promoting factor WASL-like n=1 Tax=Macrobrachium nipponense TaxID=159736 RepID=UPI0030C873F9
MSWMSVPPPSVASVPNTSVPPPNHNASGPAASATPAMDAKPPSGPPPSAPPPPEDPPPPPPPDEDKEKIGSGNSAIGVSGGGYSTISNTNASKNASGDDAKFDESTDEDLKEFDRQFANWERNSLHNGKKRIRTILTSLALKNMRKIGTSGEVTFLRRG